MDSSVIIPKYVKGQQLTVENMEAIHFEIVRRAYDFDLGSIIYTLKSLDPFPAKTTIEVDESYLNNPGEYEPYILESTVQDELKSSPAPTAKVAQEHKQEQMKVCNSSVPESHATELGNQYNVDLNNSQPSDKTVNNSTELAFCWDVLKELLLPKHYRDAYFFVAPVDPIALNIPTYLDVIKKPMDLGTIKHKLESGQYNSADDFREDVEQIFLNTYKFNPKNATVNVSGRRLEKVFKKKWSEMDAWMTSYSNE